MNRVLVSSTTSPTTKSAAPSTRPRILRKMLSLDDFEVAASRHLPRPIFAFVAGGCETDAALRDNRKAFSDYGFVPKVLRGVSNRTQTTSLFGLNYAAPFGIAPMGLCALTAYRGDIALASAAARANIPMIMSASSLVRLEDVIKANPDAWFQAYVPGEPEQILALLERVEQAGYGTLVVTADVAVSGNRENNIRAGFSTPLRPSLRLAWDGAIRPNWLFGTALRTLMMHGLPHFENSHSSRGVPIIARNVMRDFGARDHLTWDHVRLIRRRWQGRLVIKGILSPDDAIVAQECGVDGIIVSNHGGRQLDGAISPMRVLPEIVDAVPGLPVMMDGGVRRGGDVLKAIGLGARFVFVGRPFNYAASVAGEAGVEHAIRLLTEEIARNMALLGVSAVAEMDATRLRLVGSA